MGTGWGGHTHEVSWGKGLFVLAEPLAPVSRGQELSFVFTLDSLLTGIQATGTLK